MRYQVPLAAALVALSLSLSGCQQGKSAEIPNNPPVASSSPSPEPGQAANAEPVQLKGPNAVPKDTRIVVNIPAFRMDVFREGSLLKSYKIGIGYPQFPLPTGNLRHEKFLAIWNDSPAMNEVRSIRLKDLTTCSGCGHVGGCSRCPGLAYMEGNMRGPSSADCEKSFVRTGIWSANMVKKFENAPALVQIAAAI